MLIELNCGEKRWSLPLREVVSWNTGAVTLNADPTASTFAWGSELKCRIGQTFSDDVWSTSAWGSELKYPADATLVPALGLPLREVVSWNDFLDLLQEFLHASLPLREVVSWNAYIVLDKISEAMSTSAWGSELKCQSRRWGIGRYSSLPLREVVSWNPPLAADSCTVLVYLCVR